MASLIIRAEINTTHYLTHPTNACSIDNYCGHGQQAGLVRLWQSARFIQLVLPEICTHCAACLQGMSQLPPSSTAAATAPPAGPEPTAQPPTFTHPPGAWYNTAQPTAGAPYQKPSNLAQQLSLNQQQHAVVQGPYKAAGAPAGFVATNTSVTQAASTSYGRVALAAPAASTYRPGHGAAASTAHMRSTSPAGVRGATTNGHATSAMPGGAGDLHAQYQRLQQEYSKLQMDAQSQAGLATQLRQKVGCWAACGLQCCRTSDCGWPQALGATAVAAGVDYSMQQLVSACHDVLMLPL